MFRALLYFSAERIYRFSYIPTGEEMHVFGGEREALLHSLGYKTALDLNEVICPKIELRTR